ncbi:probable UDP-3-O-acyl-N-acetylglucosamine deacetylase 5, m [Coccomyxa sp. Obi]|nr:probable UDP-3-O-acyl-N-acetylglucosamine deacetylase 5, m [Coccomyxa sp. Obi]
MPVGREYQQTVKRSFTLGGIGLHSGNFASVRVRPAFAGEGRYFVRVPFGTLQRGGSPEVENEIIVHERLRAMSAEDEDTTVRRFIEFLSAQDKGYEGSYEEWHWDTYGSEALTAAIRRLNRPKPEPEQPVGPRPSEGVLQASLDNVVEGQHMLTSLSDGNMHVHSVESLLSALECCGVDNARIEIEGGEEVPVVDGSAMGWAINIVVVGLQPAHAAGDSTAELQPRRAHKPSEVVTVQEGDAFVSFYPGDFLKITCGVDYPAAPIIGKQWYSWVPDEDEHYRWIIAPARTFYTSLEEVYELRSRGLIKGGTIGAALIAYGSDWYEDGIARFYDDEPARHRIVDLTGDLALLSEDGNRGLPIGHIIAHNADHALHVKFAKAFREACSADDMVDVEPPPEEEEPST